MTRGLVWHGRIYTTGGHKAPWSTRFGHYVVPAIALAFLCAVIAGILIVRNPASSARLQSVGQGTDIEDSAAVETTTPSSLPAAESSMDSNQPTSIDSKTTLRDGHVSTEVTVNGQPVPVNSQGSTQQTITDDHGQTNLNLQITNNQSATNNGFSFTNSSTSSSSTSFQFINH